MGERRRVRAPTVPRALLISTQAALFVRADIPPFDSWNAAEAWDSGFLPAPGTGQSLKLCGLLGPARQLISHIQQGAGQVFGFSAILPILVFGQMCSRSQAGDSVRHSGARRNDRVAGIIWATGFLEIGLSQRGGQCAEWTGNESVEKRQESERSLPWELRESCSGRTLTRSKGVPRPKITEPGYLERLHSIGG